MKQVCVCARAPVVGVQHGSVLVWSQCDRCEVHQVLSSLRTPPVSAHQLALEASSVLSVTLVFPSVTLDEQE